MTTGLRNSSDGELHPAMHCVRYQHRHRPILSWLATAVSFGCWFVSGLSAQEKEPPRLFRGGLVQQLRSLTEDASPSRSESTSTKKVAGGHLTDDAPKIPTPRPVGEKSGVNTPTETRTTNLRNNYSNTAIGERSKVAASTPSVKATKANKAPASKSQTFSNESVKVNSKTARTAELGVPVTNPKLANEAHFQLHDKAESHSSGYSANSKYDAAKSKDNAATNEAAKVFNESPKVQAVESMSQAPKVSRKPLPVGANTSLLASDPSPEQAATPIRAATKPAQTTTGLPALPTLPTAPATPAGLKPMGGTYALEQTNAPEQTSLALPTAPEYPSLQVPSFAAPGAAGTKQLANPGSGSPSNATKLPLFTAPPAGVNQGKPVKRTDAKTPDPQHLQVTPADAPKPPRTIESTAKPNVRPQASSTPNSVDGGPTNANSSPASGVPRATNPIRATGGAPGTDEHMTMETPRLQVLLKGPQDMPVGTPADYQVLVRNVDDIPLDGVVLRLEIPNGVAINQGKPTHGELQTERTQDGATLVTWTFTNLPAFQHAAAPMQLTAKAPRNFAVALEWTLLPKTGEAQFSVRQARLELALEGPSEAEFGVANMYRLTVRNPGSAAAKNVKVKLGAASFGASETQIDEILPGEQQSIDVELTFNEKGTIGINAEAVAAELRSSASIDVLVKQAFITAAISGSDRVYHGSPSIYEVRMQNTGDLDSRTVRAELTIPEGTEVLVKPAGAVIENDKLTWEIPAIKAGQNLAFPLELNLWTAGEHKLSVACISSHGQPAVASLTTIVEAIADLKLVVNDPIAPAPVGGTVTYEMSITNRGSRAATNVRAVAQFSEGIEPVHADGAQHRIVTGQVIFEPLARIEAGETKVLRVQAKAAGAGTHRFRAEVRSDESELRLVQEETTQYLDSASRIASPINNSKVVR